MAAGTLKAGDDRERRCVSPGWWPKYIAWKAGNADEEMHFLR
jgi:hypothetical protein